MKTRKVFWVLTAVLMLCSVMVTQAAGPTGAIFTTTPDGTIVNENVRYESKLEVYLDGGPGPNAPQTAAGLDDGWYVFQVTDPSGKYLLSQDPSKCRVFEVENGIIIRLVPPSELDSSYSDTYKKNGNNYVACHIPDDPEGVAGKSGQHDTNYDVDYGPPAIVIQLMPFADTPNPGGVYKAWAEKYASYLAKGGELDKMPVPVNGAAKKECSGCFVQDPGFATPQTDTKTDNFKVKMPGKPPVPPEITVKKFHDKDFDGVFDEGQDEWVTGWLVEVTDPLNITNSVYTPETIIAEPPGDWYFDEDNPANTLQTASYVDGMPTVPFPTDPVKVSVAGTSMEKHEVVFGNVGLGQVKACKIYDRDGDGKVEDGEPAIAGWKMELTGTLADGSSFGPLYQLTAENGCTTFSDLLPGAYTLTEILPTGNWYASGATTYSFTVVSTLTGSVISGGSFEYTFTNYCVKYVNFDTKGYWHNKNGLTELYNDPNFQDLLTYINSLDPYDDPSGYFDNGEEPFDGYDEFGNPVPPAIDAFSEYGAVYNEISQFLVDPNAGGGGGDQEQLAQQLLAFIFNANYRLGSLEVTIQLPGGTWMSAQAVIEAAVAAWASETKDDDKMWQEILNSLNENDYVPVISYYPCPVVYPEDHDPLLISATNRIYLPMLHE